MHTVKGAESGDDFFANFLMKGITQIMGQIERGAMQKQRAEEQAAEDGEVRPLWFNMLDIEIWRHIVSYLVPPRPKPLSGRTKQEYIYQERSVHRIQRDEWATLPDISDSGCTSREDIRARDLACLMRVSIAFNQITADFLYTHVITDSLPLLLQGVGILKAPTHLAIESKEKLLARTRTLQLEYLSKGDGRYTSYTSLMQNPLLWDLMGNIRHDMNAIHQCADEALQIADTLEDVQRPILSVTPGPYFTKLTHLSVGAIFGAHEFIWDGTTHPATNVQYQARSSRPEDQRPPIRKLVENCRESTMRLFKSSPILQYCSRSTYGPYAMPTAFVWGPSPRASSPSPSTSPTFTFHFSTKTEYV